MEDPKEQKKPVIPTLKDAQKPQVKIKGLAGATSLIERLKQFKKKDLAFMAAGLGVLFMTPIAEHYMMSPEGGDKGFAPGFGARGGVFGNGGSPYEGGVTGMAPGGPTGGGDVITPLNVRDPSALVMGPNSGSQPPATATTTPPPPSKGDSSDWKDALANSASKAASEATKKASLPVPRPAMANAALRGLGAAAGGGGGSYTLPAISAGNVPNRGSGSNSLSQVRSAPGYKGVTRGSGPQSGAMENLRKAAAAAGSDLNRAGSAGGNLESAASHQMPGGGASEGGGGPGAGGADKGVGGSQDKGSKSLGESLEFLRLKEEQSKSIDLKWKKKEKQEMLWLNMKEKMTEEMLMTPLKALTADVTKAAMKVGSPAAGKYTCDNGRKFPGDEVEANCEVMDPKTQKTYCFNPPTKAIWLSAKYVSGVADGLLGKECKLPEDVAPTGNTDQGVDHIDGAKINEKLGPTPVEGGTPLDTLEKVCGKINSWGKLTDQAGRLQEGMYDAIKDINSAAASLHGRLLADAEKCKGKGTAKPEDSAAGQLEALRTAMQNMDRNLHSAGMLARASLAAVYETPGLEKNYEAGGKKEPKQTGGVTLLEKLDKLQYDADGKLVPDNLQSKPMGELTEAAESAFMRAEAAAKEYLATGTGDEWGKSGVEEYLKQATKDKAAIKELNKKVLDKFNATAKSLGLAKTTVETARTQIGTKDDPLYATRDELLKAVEAQRLALESGQPLSLEKVKGYHGGMIDKQKLENTALATDVPGMIKTAKDYEVKPEGLRTGLQKDIETGTVIATKGSRDTYKDAFSKKVTTVGADAKGAHDAIATKLTEIEKIPSGMQWVDSKLKLCVSQPMDEVGNSANECK